MNVDSDGCYMAVAPGRDCFGYISAMQFFIELAIAFCIMSPVAFAADAPPTAAQTIEKYLQLPIPENDVRGQAQTVRYETLQALKRAPDDVPAAIAAALKTTTDSRQRVELIQALRERPSKSTAEICTAALADPSSDVRGAAIQCLRLYSGRVDKVGPSRKEVSPQSDPKVEGLVPTLIKAADDVEPLNRLQCMYALADTLDPAAVVRLQSALKDSDENVRLAAACLLTEFNDNRGLPELKAALARQRAAIAKSDPKRFMNAGRLIASFDRITGKSFGVVPMNPMLSSDSRQAVKLEAEHDRLIEVWAQWWEWQPKK